MPNPYLVKIAEDLQNPPAKKPSTFLHALGTETTAIGLGLSMKAVGSRFGGGKFGNALAKSKIGRAASKLFWGQKDVGGRVLTGELGEYAGSIGGVYGALKYKEHADEKRAKNAYLQKAASLAKAH